MPALDLDQILDAAIWTLLEANLAFTTAVDAGRRLKSYTDGDARTRIHRGVNDYPQVKLEVAGGSVGQNAGKVFAQNDVAFTHATVDTIIPITQTATIFITYDKEPATDATALESAIRAALYAKYPTLGLARTVLQNIAKTKDKDPGGLPRTKLVLTVARRVYHSTLV